MKDDFGWSLHPGATDRHTEPASGPCRFCWREKMLALFVQHASDWAYDHGVSFHADDIKHLTNFMSGVVDGWGCKDPGPTCRYHGSEE